jgi:hypothetical protein
MNVALPRTAHKSRYLGVMLGVLIVVAILGAVRVWTTSDSDTVISAATNRSTTFTFTHDQIPLMLYLIESDEQYDAIIAGEAAAANERFAAGMADPGYSLLIMKASTPEEERNVSDVLEFWRLNGSPIRMFDYRGLDLP